MSAPQSAESQGRIDPQMRLALGSNSDRSQTSHDVHDYAAAVGQLPDDQIKSDFQQRIVVGSKRQPATNEAPSPEWLTSLADPLLYLLAESLTDLERTRIAAENRLRQLTRTATDKDGLERGFGLGDDVPAVKAQRMIADSLLAAEHGADLALRRRLRGHPLGPWVTATAGVGPRQGARLIACIGDPYWNTLHDRPRTVSELWAYCGLHVLPGVPSVGDAQSGIQNAPDGGDGDVGHHDADTHRVLAGVAAKRRKGQQSNWSSDAKMRAYLVATSCLKVRKASCHLCDGSTEHVANCACSPYRIVYDARRAHTAVTHPDWPLGHSHNDALRIASKALLKDLWREARRVHGGAA